MTAFHFFGQQLFVLYTWVGHGGLILATGAAAALALVLRQQTWVRLSPPEKRKATWIGGLFAGAMGVVLAAGLRVSGTAYDPLAPAMLWETLVAFAAGAGVVTATWAAGSGLAAFIGGQAIQTVRPATPAAEPILTAVTAFLALKAGVERLRRAHQEAATRAQLVADGVAAAEYVKAAEAIRHQLQLAEELQSVTGAAVLRLASGAPLRGLLSRRPDAVLARLNDAKATTAPQVRVADAVGAVRTFMREIEMARSEIRRELSGAPGSVSARLGLDATARASPIDAAVSQIEATYGRVGHRLEALSLRIGAETDSGAVADAAMALTGQASLPPKDLVEVALEMTHAEQSAESALTALGSAPARITEVLVQASGALARDSSDDEAVAEVLRSVRRELER